MYYTPTVDETPVTAAEIDVSTSFSIVVEAPAGMSEADVKAAITAVDTNAPDSEQVVDITPNGDGSFIITGLRPYYEDDGGIRYDPGFIPGHAYKITLNDDSLTFRGENESVREYDFTVAREESMNIELRDDIVYIEASQVEGTLDAGLLEVGDDGIKNAGEDVTGTFTLKSAQTRSANGTPQVGDIVAVYKGIRPDLRDATSNDERNTAPISYVRITAIDGDGTYHYEGVETRDVLDMPEIFPVSVFDDQDGNRDDNSITVSTSVFDYAGGAFSEAGLDADAKVDLGDYIAFYTGYLDTEADSTGSLDGSNAALDGYARITSFTDNEDGTYTIVFTDVSLNDIMTEQSTYTSQDMDMDQLFTQEELSQMEEEIAQDVLNDGTAAQMAQAVAKVALTGESLEVLRQELGLTELSVNSSAGTAALSSMSRASARSDVSVKVNDASAKIDTSAPHFGGSGLTVRLTINFTVTINQNLKLDFDIVLEQQLKIVLKAGVDTVCEWLWGFIPYPDWIVTASIDIYSYTGLDIDMNATTDDGQVEIPDYVDMIYELINGGGGDEETAETLASLYRRLCRTTATGWSSSNTA